MSGTHSIAIYSGIFVAAAAACVGFAAIWANPKRRINRIFFSASLHVAVWLICRYLASAMENLLLYRITTAIGALTHFHLWLIKETVADGSERFTNKIIRGRWWLVVAILLAALCFTEWFIPTPGLSGEAESRRYGAAFYVYIVTLLTLFLSLCIETFKQTRTQTGVQRLELQLLLFGGSGSAIIVISLMVLRTILRAEWMPFLVPYVVLMFYAVTTIAITTSRVFDARQILFVTLQKACLVGLVSLAAFCVFDILVAFISAPISLLLTVAVGLWAAGVLGQWLDHVFRYYPKAQSARQAAFLAAQEERRVDGLEKEFATVLKGWGHADHAFILSVSKSTINEVNGVVGDDVAVVRCMRILRWATPERLSRERQTRERSLVSEYLKRKSLGVMVLEEGLAQSVLIGVGIGASRRPFTYPQVTQLMELASIMGNALERAHFSAKVQHTEQLATVGLLGASLAHEIRNPLVSIKTFVQLLPSHYQEAAFREKFFRLISDEVGRIDQLTDQLLDLASPRTYLAQMIDLHPLLRSSVELVAAKAAHRQVELITDLNASPDKAFTDASAAKQVLLNLCFNAIQAVETNQTEARWIRISTRNIDNGIEMAVADSGPGIAPEIRPRLFQPFQTTKSSGFGLGLAICSDILANLRATISVDPLEPGKGATFRVVFPCRA